jgi:ribosomal protein S18 acetylase RimI-like enzyme
MSTPDGLTIRKARRDDVEAIVDIFRGDEIGHGDAEGPLDLGPYLDAFDRIAASSDHVLYVALTGDRVVGTFQCSLLPGLVARGRTRMKIESVHVRGELRGRGIGAVMMDYALAEARRLGVGLVELNSRKNRRDAHRFYERLGFDNSHEGFKMVLADP